jgi:hypothetical protein
LPKINYSTSSRFGFAAKTADKKPIGILVLDKKTQLGDLGEVRILELISIF